VPIAGVWAKLGLALAGKADLDGAISELREALSMCLTLSERTATHPFNL
jgi:hypothetical protein